RLRLLVTQQRELGESSGIEQPLDTFANGELPQRVLARDLVGAAHTAVVLFLPLELLDGLGHRRTRVRERWDVPLLGSGCFGCRCGLGSHVDPPFRRPFAGGKSSEVCPGPPGWSMRIIARQKPGVRVPIVDACSV